MLNGIENLLSVKKSTKIIIVAVSVLTVIMIGALLFISAGANPLKAYYSLFKAAFGSFYGFSEVLVKAIPLILCGLAVSFAAKSLLWNIGCEGQLIMGGVASSAVALFLPGYVPAFMILPLMVIAGFVGGGLWALIPAVLKTTCKVNEILTSLMLNYVALKWFHHLYYGPWQDPAKRGFPGTAAFIEAAHLPRFFGTRIHFGLVFAILAVFLVYFIFSYTKWGYEINVLGENPEAARYAGIKINKNIVTVMFLSGALAGLAGMAETSGIHHRLQAGLASGYGYTGILIAFLSGLNPFVVVAVSILFGVLSVGGFKVQMIAHVPSSISDVLQAVILYCVVIGSAIIRGRGKLTWKGGKQNGSG